MIEQELQQLEKKHKIQQIHINTVFKEIDQMNNTLHQIIQKKVSGKSNVKKTYGPLISKVVLLNIVQYLDAKQIIQMRRINRQFHNIINTCLPFILEQRAANLELTQNSFSQAYLKQHQDELQEVNFDNMATNLKQIEYEYTGKIHSENMFCLNLMFDLLMNDMLPWRKAKLTFQMKIKIIQEQIKKNIYFLHYFNLSDKEIDILKLHAQVEFRQVRPYEELYDDLNQYCQNLINLAKLPNYKQLRDHYKNQLTFDNLKRQYRILKNIQDHI